MDSPRPPAPPVMIAHLKSWILEDMLQKVMLVLREKKWKGKSISREEKLSGGSAFRKPCRNHQTLPREDVRVIVHLLATTAKSKEFGLDLRQSESWCAGATFWSSTFPFSTFAFLLAQHPPLYSRLILCLEEHQQVYQR